MVSIGLVLSEEKIFEKVYDVRRTPSDGKGSGELKRDVCGKGGAAGGDKVLGGHRKNANRYAQVLKTVRET